MEVKRLETALTIQPGVKYVCTGGNTAQQILIQEISNVGDALPLAGLFFLCFGTRKSHWGLQASCVHALVATGQQHLPIHISLSRFQGTEVLSRAISLYWKDREGFTKAAEEWAGPAPPEPRKQEGEEAWSRAPAHPGRGVHTMLCRKGGL